MTNWVRTNFFDEVEDYCKENGIPFKVILILDECFRAYFTNESVHPNIKLLFLASGENNNLSLRGLVFDTKCIVDSFITRYLYRMLDRLQAGMTFEWGKTFEQLLEEFSIMNAIDLINRVTIESYQNHVEALRGRLCPRCSTVLNSPLHQDLTSSQKYAPKNEPILNILQVAKQLSIDIDLFNLLDYLESHSRELNNTILVEDLQEVKPNSPESTSSNSLPESNSLAKPLATPAKTPNALAKRKSNYNPTNEEVCIKKIRLRKYEVAEDHLKTAVAALRRASFKDNALSNLEEITRQCSQEIEKFAKELSFSAPQKRISDMFPKVKQGHTSVDPNGTSK